jgi:hypothetical protein
MALSEFQRGVCRLLADTRIRGGESYVAGAAALNELLKAPRVSRDVDLFHDTEEALAWSWKTDREALAQAGYALTVLRERPTFVEATVARGRESVAVQWVHDSAFRFFPLEAHPDFGLVLHPLDLATGKVLALVGRVEPRDLVDTLTCDRDLQPLGYLAWAACGKDPGYSPSSILELAARANRYSEAEIQGLDFEGVPESAAELSRRLKRALAEGSEIAARLPAAEAGKLVLARDGRPYRGPAADLPEALSGGGLLFHPGSIRGAFPRLRV